MGSLLLGSTPAKAIEYYYIDGTNPFVGIPGTFSSPWQPNGLVIGDRGTGVLVVDLNSTVVSTDGTTFMASYSTGSGRIEVRNWSTFRTSGIQTGAGQAQINLDTNATLTANHDIQFYDPTQSGGYAQLHAKGGSSFSAQNMTLGQNGTGSLWMESGATGTLNDLNMAIGTGTSEVKLDGAGTALSVNTLDSSYTSTNSYSVQLTNSAKLTTTNVDLGSDFADTATISIGSGASWVSSLSDSLNLGGSSSMSITSGGSFSGASAVFSSTTGTPSLLISGADSSMTLSSMLYIGAADNAEGLVAVESGGSLSAFNVILASGKGSDSFANPPTLVVRGANSVLSASNVITVGQYSAAIMSVQDGGLVTASTIRMADKYRAGGTDYYGKGTIYLKGTSTGRGVIETSRIESLYGTRAQIYFDGGILRAKVDTSDFLSNFGANDLTIQSGGLYLDTNGHYVEMNSSLYGTGGLSKSGAGQLQFDVSQYYTGATSISAGTMTLSSGVTLASTDFSLSGDGLLEILGTNQLSITSLSGTGGRLSLVGGSLLIQQAVDTTAGVALAGTGSIATSGSGELTLTGDGSDFAGSISVDGRLTLANAKALGDGNRMYLYGTLKNTVGMVSNHTMSLDNTDAAATINTGAFLTLNNPLSGLGSLNKAGSAILTLIGAQTYAGATTIQAGTLKIQDGSLASPSVAIAAGRLLFTGNGSYAGAVTGAGSLEREGSGTLVYTGAATQTGGTVVNGGTIQIGNGGTTGSIGSAISLLNNGSLVFNRSNAASQLTVGGAISGAGSLTLTSGLVALSGSNTFTGNLTINGGTLGVGSNSSLGESLAAASRPKIILNGGGIRADGSARTIVNAVDMNGTFTLGRLTNLSGVNTLTGNSTIVSANTGSSAASQSTLAAIGQSGGARSLTFTEGTDPIGTIILSGDNTYTGGTNITGGTVALGASERLANAGALSIGGGTFSMGAYNETVGAFSMSSGSVTGSGTLTASSFGLTGGSIAANLAGTGVALTKSGSGAATLSGASTYTGGSVLSNGTLSLGSTGALGTLGAITMSGGTLQFTSSNRVDYSGRLSAANQQYKFDTNGQDVAFANVLTSTGGTLNKSGAGLLTLSAGGAYSGSTTISGGTLRLGAALNSATTVDLTASGAALDINRNTQSLGSLSGVAGSLVYLGDGALTIGSANTDTTFAGILSGSGGVSVATGGRLIKGGTGTTIFTGVNTYSGGTTINAGKLAINGDSALGGGQVTINGGTLGNTTDFISSKTITLGTSGGTIDAANGFMTFSNAFAASTGGLTKSGSRILTLTGAQGYTGATSVTGGILKVQSGSLASSGVTIASGAKLTFAGTGNYAGGISGAGIFERGGGGTTVYTGTATHAGGTSIGDGVLQLGDGTTNGSLSGAISIGDSATLAVNRIGTDASMANVLSGAGTFQKDGAGTVILTNNNTGFTGGVMLNSGTLGLGDNGALGTGRLTINGGTIRASGAARSVSNALTLNGDFALGRATEFTGAATLGNNITITSTNPAPGSGEASVFSGVISGAGKSLTFAAGANPASSVILSGDNTYTGGTVINGGVVALGASERLANTGALTVAGGAFQMDAYNETVGAFSISSGSVTGTGQLTASSYALTGGIVSTRLAGSGGLTKDGSGTATLSGVNSYTGGTVLSAGTLSLGSAGAIGTSGTISMNGGTLQFTSANTTDYSSRISTAAGQQYKFDTNGQDVVMKTALSSDGGTLAKLGDGTLTLAPGGLTSGNTTISGGTLRLTLAEAAVMRLEANVGVSTVNGNVTNWADQSGHGNNATAAFGNVTVGTLTGGAQALVFSGAGLTTPLASSGLSYTLFSVVQTSTAGGNKTILGSSVDGNLQFRLAGLGTEVLKQGIESLASTGPVLSVNQPALVATAVTSGSESLYVGGVLLGSGNQAYTPSGGGSTFLIGSNASGSETMTGKIAALIAYDHVLTAVEVAQVTAYLNYKYFGGPVATLPVVHTLYTSAAAVDITNSGAALDVNGAYQSIGSLSGVAGTYVYLGDGQLTAGSANTDTTFAGSMRDAGGASVGTGGAFTKVGAGTTTLTGISTYSGGTTIKAGVLSINGDSALGTGHITLNGGTLRNTTGFVSSKSVTLGSSGGTFDTTGGFLTFNNAISGSGPLAKTGSRILTLVGAQTYTGATTVTGGTLKVQDGSLASSSVAVSSGARILFNGAGRYANAFTGAGSLEHEVADTTLTLTGNSTIASTRVLSGKIQLGDGTTNGTLTGTIEIDSGATFAVNRVGSAATMFNAISGGGAFLKEGGGALILAGSNTYTGATTITAGTLIVNGSIAGDATVQSGATLGGRGTIGGSVNVESGGTLSPGNSPGLLTVEGDLTLGAGSTLVMQFAGLTEGLYDQLDVQGTFVAGGTLNLVLIDGFTPAYGATFTLFTGLIPGFDEGSITTNLNGGLSWDTSKLKDQGIVEVVPEPSTYALLIAGLLVTLAIHRRRLRAA